MPFQNWFHRTQKKLERSPTLIQPYWFNRSSGLGGLDNKSCMTWRPFITFNNRIALKYLIFFFIQTSKRKIEKTVLHNFDKRMQQWEDNKALKTCHCVWKKHLFVRVLWVSTYPIILSYRLTEMSRVRSPAKEPAFSVDVINLLCAYL